MKYWSNLVVLSLLLILFKQQTVYGQNIIRCATMEKMLKNIPNHQKKEVFYPYENWLSNRIKQLKRKRTTQSGNNPLVIPVVVHVIHSGETIGEGNNIPEAQVLSQIEVLNEDFRRINNDRINTPDVFEGVAADTQIEFRLALLDPNGNILEEPGIHRVLGERQTWNDFQIDGEIKPITSWDPSRYMNFWVANLGNSLLGYASWPKISGNEGVPFESGGNEQDGVVINNIVFGSNFTRFGTFEKITDNRYNRGRTTTHEVGHYFGLLHPWGVVGGCNDDDFCEDTPTTSFNRDDVVSPCTFPDPERPNTCQDDVNDLPDMFQNYMDYTADACMNLFTNDQADRMLTTLQNSPNRIELLTSQVIPPANAPSIITITGNATTSYEILWQDNTTNEGGFIIERANSPFGNYTELGTLTANTTSYEDSPGDGIFYYRVKAINLSGESEYAIPTATPNIPPPNAPSNLLVIDYNQDSVLLSWQNNSESTTSFEVFIDENSNGNFVKFENSIIPGTVSNFWIDGLQAETSYKFRVTATNVAGSSPFSNNVSITTLPFPPNAPSELNLVFNNVNSRFELSWNDNSDNEDSFSIFRSNLIDGQLEQVASVQSNRTSWIDDTFSPPVFSIYEYRISANNIGGSSPLSNVALYDGVSEFEDEPLENSLVVYPNPTESLVYINAVLEQDEQEAQVFLANATGQILLDTKVPTQNKIWYYTIDVSNYPSGVYFLRFVTSKGAKTVQLLRL